MRASSNKNTGKPRPPVATSDDGNNNNNNNNNGRRGRGFGGGKTKSNGTKIRIHRPVFAFVFHRPESVRTTDEGELLREVREREIRIKRKRKRRIDVQRARARRQIDCTGRRAVLEEHALRRLFPLLDDGGERESVFRRVAIGLGANSLAGIPRLGENSFGVCASQSESFESVLCRLRRFRFDESFEEDYDGR